MNLYLVQHGKAKAEEEDPRRPLSEQGRQELLKVANFIKAHPVVSAETIYHSEKLRAGQTAEMLAEVINPPGGIKVATGMSPMDDPAIWAGKIAEMHQDIMLTGHLPHLSRLASLLLTGDPAREPIHVRNGGIVCLLRDPDHVWTVEWIITPGILI